MYEPTLRTDGLTLVARVGGPVTQEPNRAAFVLRPATDQPFGAWQGSELPLGAQDPCYFDWNEQERLIAALGESPRRHLGLCSPTDPSATCNAVTVLHTSGAEIADDMDGPSVVDVGGALLMVFNVRPGGGLPALYSAKLTNPPDLSTWIATPSGMPDLPDAEEDDPALSPDGTVILFSVWSKASQADIWVAYRENVASSFSAPKPLPGINSSAEDTEAALYSLPSGKLELFFRTNRPPHGVYPRIFRSVCAR
jgi:hypothetical protein